MRDTSQTTHSHPDSTSINFGDKAHPGGCLTPQPKDQAGDDGPRLRLPYSSAERSSRRRSGPRLRRRRPVTPVRLALGDFDDDTTPGGDDKDEEKWRRSGLFSRD
ncbi:hypothetical protein Droror1_Dr00004738 [Drosera rotundifolia]